MVTDVVTLSLGNIENLFAINLSKTKITKASAYGLARLKHLKEVDGLSDRSLKKARELPGDELQYRLCTVQQSGVERDLRSVARKQKEWRWDYETYDGDLKKIRFSPRNKTYAYEVKSVTRSTFLIEAHKVIDGRQDVWTINHRGQLLNPESACAGLKPD